jgi:hypothetical protein
MINATNTGVKRELVPSGNFVARCYSMIHVGTIKENIKGEDKWIDKIKITWELPTELRVFKIENGEQPMVISQDFTLSMNEKANLRKFLESWRGKGFTEDQAESFDVTKLLGIPCMLNIIHKVSKSRNEYAVISSVAALPKGVICADQINEMFEFNYGDKFSEEAIESQPDFIKNKIKSSVEYMKLKSPESNIMEAEIVPEGDNEDDGLPF